MKGPSDILDLVSQVSVCRNDVDLAELLADASDSLELSCIAFVYRLSFTNTKAKVKIFTHSDGQALMEMMSAESVLMIPWVRYALGHTAVALQSDLGESNDTAWPATYGAIVPAPSAVNHMHSGGLYAGASASNPFDLPQGSRNLITLRGFAMTLLEWHIHAERDAFIERTRVTALDSKLLGLAREGLPSKIIARRLALSTSSIDSRFHRINRRFGTRDRRAAASLALAHGLLMD